MANAAVNRVLRELQAHSDLAIAQSLTCQFVDGDDYPQLFRMGTESRIFSERTCGGIRVRVWLPILVPADPALPNQLTIASSTRSTGAANRSYSSVLNGFCMDESSDEPIRSGVTIIGSGTFDYWSELTRGED